VCTLSDPEARETIKDLLKNVGTRVVPVGRLDFHTSGALLLTNDGEFAMKLAHPSGKVPKEYVAKVRGVLNETTLERFAKSIEIDGRRTQPADVQILRVEGDKTWITITLREGKNRQVRRLGDEAGFPVLRLSRLSHAGITTEGLRPGQWRALTRDELIDLKQAYGVPRRPRSAELSENRPAPRTIARPRPAPKRGAALNRPSSGGASRAGGGRAPSGRRGTSR
jgi:23S rRNA pseudouridine2605 synthase